MFPLLDLLSCVRPPGPSYTGEFLGTPTSCLTNTPYHPLFSSLFPFVTWSFSDLVRFFRPEVGCTLSLGNLSLQFCFVCFLFRLFLVCRPNVKKGYLVLQRWGRYTRTCSLWNSHSKTGIWIFFFHTTCMTQGSDTIRDTIRGNRGNDK